MSNRTSRQPQQTKPSRSIKPTPHNFPRQLLQTLKDKWIETTALIIGVVSLAFSLQANMIAQQMNELTSRQLSPELIVLSSSYRAGSYHGSYDTLESNMVCSQSIRLANLGGAATSIIGYEAVIKYRESEVRVASDESSAFTIDELNPHMKQFQFNFVKPDVFKDWSPFSAVDPKNRVLFPLQIEAHSTNDIDTMVHFKLQGSIKNGDLGFPQGQYQYTRVGWTPPPMNDNLPVLQELPETALDVGARHGLKRR